MSSLVLSGVPVRTRISPQGPPGHQRRSSHRGSRPRGRRTANGVHCQWKWRRFNWDRGHAIRGRKCCSSQKAARGCGFYTFNSEIWRWWSSSNSIKGKVDSRKVQTRIDEKDVCISDRGQEVFFKETFIRTENFPSKQWHNPGRPGWRKT